jgi:quercetin dioxygenase-like cupin family protein
VFVGEEHGAGVSLVLIDASPGEAQQAHTHPVEEVAAVEQGAAKFCLGERQARVVRTGEVVRVPAGVPHRWVAEPGDNLRMVAVYAGAQIVTEPA